ncbi:preprotein translocase subunit YajC [Leucobacter chinensis]|uniref:preprotein translocase subunit YajC n=1 Tax=Leucobacter chinensis TaxID=2851010 RepID=UPI001C23CB97|nr:preprotein translocase subunit YajC [Leucobacter chinensis]
MLALIGLLVIMMVRNGRKRREQAAAMQQGLVAGAEVMLQTGIYGTFVKFDEVDENRAVIQTGDTTMVVHRNAIGQIITPVEVEAVDEEASSLAPDDDPAFGESLGSTEATTEETTDLPATSEAPEFPEAPESPKSDEK